MARAWNSKCIPYEHGLEQRTSYTVLSVRKFAGVGLNKVTDPINIPPPDITTKEKDGSAYRGLWVGMFLPTINVDKVLVRPTKGSSIQKSGNVTVLATAANAARVVVDITSAQNKYYALVNPEDGLCAGYRVTGTDVFFFDEFRDDKVTADAYREAASTNLIKAWKDTYQTNVAKKAKESNRVQKLSEQVAGNIAGAPWVLNALKQVLAKYDKDLFHMPGAKFTGLYRLLDIDKAYEYEDAIKAVGEMCSLWNDLESLNILADEILLIAEGLRAAGMVMEYRLLRPFLVEAISRMRAHEGNLKTDDEGEEDVIIKDLVYTLLAHVKLQMGSSMPVTEPTGVILHWQTLWKIGITEVENLVEYGDAYSEAIKKTLEGRATNMSISELFDAFSRSVDIDTAKTIVHDLFYAAIEELSVRDIGVLSKLRKHLAKLKLLDKQHKVVESQNIKIVD